MPNISNVTTLSQAWGTGPGLIPPVDTVWAIRSHLDGRGHLRPGLTKAPQPGGLLIHATARWVVCLVLKLQDSWLVGQTSCMDEASLQLWARLA